MDTLILKVDRQDKIIDQKNNTYGKVIYNVDTWKPVPFRHCKNPN